MPRLKKILQRVEEIENLLSDGEVVRDSSRTQALTKELGSLTSIAQPFREYLKIQKEIEEADSLLKESQAGSELAHLYQEEKERLLKKEEVLKETIEARLLKEADRDAARNAIVEIRAGTGGEEAALFSSDLFRMYSRYAQTHGLAIEVMNSNPTGKGGFKEIIFGVSGPGAFQRFRYESGTHRVQRVPETEASGRIHTSAVTVAVLPEAEEVEIQINPTDLRIDTFRSSGPGGQHVNKTDSAVRITHVPTGLVVACQDEKSQHKNKTKAMRILRTRLLDRKRLEQEQVIQAARKKHIGTGDRSEKIRTYNFPDRRVTDHRIGLTLHNLDDILNGHIDEFVEALEKEARTRRMAGGADEN
ncbi:MAG: peptide chain release factor 1 [Candidatus Omnitrophica bacterium]|nr:peptide chain release factor 1 [Candidatus Omnitrophota bacterium]